MTEEWRVIADFPNYAVSNLGRVKRLTSRTCAKAGAILKQAWRGGRGVHKGYLAVDLCADGRKVTHSVHVLVTEAFHGKRPEGLVPNHRDGDAANNSASNLEWATQSRNVQHAYDIGLSDAKGERNGQAKLTEPDIVAIRRLSTGRRGEFTAIGKKFGISPNHAADIIRRKAWPHVGDAA
jgi:hypothetical protein